MCAERLAWLDVEFTEFTFVVVTFEESLVVVDGCVFWWCGVECSFGDVPEEVLGLSICLHGCTITKNLFHSLCFREMKKTVYLFDGVLVAEVVGVCSCEYESVVSVFC